LVSSDEPEDEGHKSGAEPGDSEEMALSDEPVLEATDLVEEPLPPASEESPPPASEGSAAPMSLEASLEAPPEAAGEIEEAQRKTRLAEDRLTEVLAAYRKLKTENEGFRDRITRNLERKFEQRRERLLLRFIDILDNLDRALEAAESAHASNSLIEGLILVRTQLLQTLQEEGLERIPVLGLPYDPNFSETVGTQAVQDPEHHHVVVKELLRGYRLNGRVARASRVVIGEHGKPVAAAPPQADLIGADEVSEPAQAEELLEPVEAVDDESTLEELVAEADSNAALAESELAEPALPDEPVTLADSFMEPEEKE
jgi:molecular chaperone GrpE